ncbi:glycosyl transferase family protein [Methylorubrum populi]|uniref:Glycosyl transferase family protein n=1 Tax=Methylorubrum populi TaxID=223967 RepID=A0A169RCW7_9HYPH|nr:glycosyl transferase family protein [Methylorubrum populi]
MRSVRAPEPASSLGPVAPGSRSALVDHPSPSPPVCPRVSIIVPIRDEAAGLEALVADLLSQDYPGLGEILFVDGGSRDGTRERLDALAARDARVRVILNERGGTAAGINIALVVATGEVVMRIDAHARYRADVVRVCVEALLRTGAGGVGSIARPRASARTPIARAIVAAHLSPFGIGVAKFRREGAEGWTATVWNGCYWRHVVDQVGPMREDLPRNEDNEFNARVRALGYGVWVTSAAHAYYRPRETLGGLWRQYRGNGQGVAMTLFENRAAVGLHHVAPLVLVSTLAALAALAPAWSPATWALASLLAVYGAVLLVATGLAARRRDGGEERGSWLPLLALPVVLATLHIAYGFGTLEGLLGQGRARVRRLLPQQGATRTRVEESR